MDTIKAALQLDMPQEAMPADFWYAATVILVSLLVLIVRYYLGKLDKQMESFKDTMRGVGEMLKVHEIEIDNLKEDVKVNSMDIRELQNGFKGSGSPKRR
jgi:hypothetical protein